MRIFVYVIFAVMAATCALAQDRIPPTSAGIAAAKDVSLSAGKRVALVIGNSDYQNTPQLVNPRNDAADMAAALKSLGFEVIEGRDLTKATMDRTISDFATALNGAQVALFFYAGHGLQVGGQNYLVPVDARLTTAAALDFEMIRLDLVHRTMERETTTNIIILDACRDNPLARNLARALGTRSTSIGRGLASVESGEGTLISYSTQPGNVALDGSGRNSPFAEALVRNITKPGEDLPSILINVRNDVMQATARKQVPWEHSAMTAKFFFVPPKTQAPAPAIPAPAGPSPDQQIELLYWGTVKDSTNPAVIRSYLEKYPQGSFAPLARALIEQFDKQGQAEMATRLGEQKRIEAEQRALDESRHAAELKRLTEAHKAELAKQAAERAQPGRTVSDEERQRLSEQLKRDDERRAADLLKAETDAKLAKDAAAAAETQRVAALKLADDTKRAADNAKKAKEAEEARAAEKIKLAALPKTEKPQATGNFGGQWTVTWTSGSSCRPTGQTGSFAVVIADDRVGGRGISAGRVTAGGASRWMKLSEISGQQVRYEGSLSGSSGSGKFERLDGVCSGTYAIRRG